MSFKDLTLHQKQQEYGKELGQILYDKEEYLKQTILTTKNWLRTKRKLVQLDKKYKGFIKQVSSK